MIPQKVITTMKTKELQKTKRDKGKEGKKTEKTIKTVISIKVTTKLLKVKTQRKKSPYNTINQCMIIFL